MREQDLLKAWQNQPMDKSPLGIEQLQAKVSTFHRATRRAYVVVLIAIILVILGYGAIVWKFPNLWVKVGSALTVVAGFFIFHQFSKRLNPRVPPENLGTQILQFYKQQLIHRRDMLRSSWVWFISPLVPGMLFYWLGMAQAYPRTRFIMMIGIAFCFAIFFAVGLVNEWCARQIQRRIDALDLSTKENQ